MNEVEHQSRVTLRCPFCLTLNDVDLSKSGDRPKCGDCAKPLLLDRPVKVSGEDFDRTVLGSGAPVLVDFYADWCAPCKYVAPLMDELAQTHEGKLLVVKVDTDQGPRSVPEMGHPQHPHTDSLQGGRGGRPKRGLRARKGTKYGR